MAFYVIDYFNNLHILVLWFAGVYRMPLSNVEEKLRFLCRVAGGSCRFHGDFIG